MKSKIIFLLFVCMMFAPFAGAEERKSAALNAKQNLSDVLRGCQEAGQSVDLHLRNGDNVGGKVADVGDHFVVLKELKGREFFSAQIKIEAIDSLEVRTPS